MRTFARRLKRGIVLPRPATLPLRNMSGEVILAYADWRRHARELYPVRFFLFEAVPRALRRPFAINLGRRQ